MSSQQSNRCKLLLDLVTKSHKDKLNNRNNDNEIMENVDVIVSLGNNF